MRANLASQGALGGRDAVCLADLACAPVVTVREWHISFGTDCKKQAEVKWGGRGAVIYQSRPLVAHQRS